MQNNKNMAGALVTLAQFLGLKAEVEVKELVVVLANPAVLEAYAAYLKAYVSGSGDGASAPVCPLVGGVPKQLKSEVSASSSASQAQSRVTYTGSSVECEDVKGYCYLKLVNPEQQHEVSLKLGSYPSFQDVLALPMRFIREDWGKLKVSGSGGVFHIGWRGMVPARDCFAAVAVRSAKWPQGSFASSLAGAAVGLPAILLAKSPMLTDLLAGEHAWNKPVHVEQERNSSVRDKLDELLSSELQIESVPVPFEARYASCEEIFAAIVFQAGRAVGMVPLESLDTGHVVQQCADLMITADDPKLACYGLGNVEFRQEELGQLSVDSLPMKVVWDAVLQERDGVSAACNLLSVTQSAVDVWGRDVRVAVRALGELGRVVRGTPNGWFDPGSVVRIRPERDYGNGVPGCGMGAKATNEFQDEYPVLTPVRDRPL